jgi:hypothetical protein
LKDEQFSSAFGLLDEHLPVGGQTYGDVKDFKADDEEEHPDHEKLRRVRPAPQPQRRRGGGAARACAQRRLGRHGRALRGKFSFSV